MKILKRLILSVITIVLLSAVSVFAADSVINNSTGNKTLKAKWNPVNYTISYNLDGGNISGQKTSYNVETDTFTLTNPTRDGYDFTGWTGTGLSTATTSVSIAKGSTGNRSYTANWKKKATPAGTLSLTGPTGGTKNISKIRIYEPDNITYHDYTSYTNMPVYANGKVVFYHSSSYYLSQVWFYFGVNGGNSQFICYGPCSFVVPSNASGAASLYVEKSSSDVYFFYNASSSWVKSSACYPVAGE